MRGKQNQDQWVPRCLWVRLAVIIQKESVLQIASITKNPWSLEKYLHDSASSATSGGFYRESKIVSNYWATKRCNPGF